MEYLRSHDIEALLTAAVNALAAASPDTPRGFLAAHFAASRTAEIATGDPAPPADARAPPAPPAPLDAEALARAEARYKSTATLRALLSHDAELGGVPIRLVSARWLLEHFQAEAHAGERLEHRQALERAHGDAPFVHGEVLERVLRELEPIRGCCQYVGKAADGEFKQLGFGIAIAFPSAAALSHMWLDPSHPDPHARNLRDEWLPALEWYYSERVRQLAIDRTNNKDARAKGPDRQPLSDEAVRAAADFGVFIDLCSMCQKEDGRRTPVEDALFRHALNSLDVIYAHKSMATLLSTRVPTGVEVARSYDDRGWTNFERAEGQLLKPDGRSIDIGLFSVDKACEEYEGYSGKFTPTWAVGRVADKSVGMLARQGSYSGRDKRGLLGSLVSAGRRAPLSPEEFAAVLATKQFTNGADASTVVELYRETATALLGSATELEYKELAWTADDYRQLGDALRYCGALEKLELEKMGVGEADVAAMVAGVAASGASLKELWLRECTSLAALPDVSSLVALKALNLDGCRSLAALPDVSSLKLSTFFKPVHLS